MIYPTLIYHLMRNKYRPLPEIVNENDVDKIAKLKKDNYFIDFTGPKLEVEKMVNKERSDFCTKN